MHLIQCTLTPTQPVSSEETTHTHQIEEYKLFILQLHEDILSLLLCRNSLSKLPVCIYLLSLRFFVVSWLYALDVFYGGFGDVEPAIASTRIEMEANGMGNGRVVIGHDDAVTMVCISINPTNRLPLAFFILAILKIIKIIFELLFVIKHYFQHCILFLTICSVLIALIIINQTIYLIFIL